jgi:hypothetical protein
MVWKLTTAEAYKLMGANSNSGDWVELLQGWKEGRRLVSGSGNGETKNTQRWVEYTEFSDYTPTGHYRVDGEGEN